MELYLLCGDTDTESFTHVSFLFLKICAPYISLFVCNIVKYKSRTFT